MMKPIFLLTASCLMLGSGAFAGVPENVLAIYNRITLTTPNGQAFTVAADDDPVFGEKNMHVDEIPGDPKGKTPAERAASVVAWVPARTSPDGAYTVTQRAWLGSLASEHLRLAVEVRPVVSEGFSLARIDYFKDISFPNAEVRLIEGWPVICGTGKDEWYLYVEDPEVAIRETKTPEGKPLWSAWKENPAVLESGKVTVFALRAGSGKPAMPKLPPKAEAKKDQ